MQRDQHRITQTVPTGRQKDDAKRKTKERLALKNRGRIQDPEAHLRYHPEPRPAQTEV